MIMIDGSTTLDAPKSNQSFLERFQVSVPAAIYDLSSRCEEKTLPTSYEPNEYDVVCGRGKGVYNRSAYKRFLAIVHAHVATYTSAKTKTNKSTVLNDIMEMVRQQNNGNVRFVKNDRKKGGWFEISNDQAREKVGHAMREAIASLRDPNRAARRSSRSSRPFPSNIDAFQGTNSSSFVSQL